MERLAINERIAAARIRLEQEGRSWGRPPRLSPLERARAADLRRAGATIRQIAVALRAPRATVARCLSQNLLAGQPPGRRTSERPGVAARK